MKAKQINEINNFERTGNSKKSMGIGYSNYEEYATRKLKEKGLDPDDFWMARANMTYEMKDKWELGEIIDELLFYTPLEYQINQIQDDLDMYIKNHE